MADSVLDGLAAGQSAAGVDLGASVAPIEPTLARELTPEPVVTEAEMAAPVAAAPAPVAAAPVAVAAEPAPAPAPAAAEPETTAAEAPAAEPTATQD